MAEQFILVRTANGVRHLTLNRPEVLNSFNIAMARELAAAVQACATDDTVRAVLLTGSGRAFCAGQDLAAATPKGAEPWPDLADVIRATYNPIIRAVRALEKPVVCAVNGVAAGAGANIALICDLTIASTSANFIQSFSKLGLLPDAAGTFLLPRLVGMQRAAGLAMLADKLSAPSPWHPRQKACRPAWRDRRRVACPPDVAGEKFPPHRGGGQAWRTTG